MITGGRIRNQDPSLRNLRFGVLRIGFSEGFSWTGGPWESPEKSWTESGGKDRESAGWKLYLPVLTPLKQRHENSKSLQKCLNETKLLRNLGCRDAF